MSQAMSQAMSQVTRGRRESLSTSERTQEA